MALKDPFFTLEKLKKLQSYSGQIHSDHFFPEKSAQYADFPPFLDMPLIDALKNQGISQLYQHQACALKMEHEGKNVLLHTQTASGKSLCYWLPILNSLLKNPDKKAMALFPTKALAQDQLRNLEALIQASPELMSVAKPAVYDGDTPSARRKKIRSESNIILTNPDMLHASILPAHGRWGRFFFSLEYVVLDECHYYRGVFGSNVSLLITRLKRLCARLGAHPHWFLSSATIQNPLGLAQDLVQEPFSEVGDDTSARGPRRFITWRAQSSYQGARYQEARRLARDFVLAGHSLIAFTQTRLQCEILGRYLKEAVGELVPDLAKRVAIYRAGYKADKRRVMEKALAEGSLSAIVATSALEVGIDIGALDVAVIFGFPGSVASFRQQAGRVGRNGRAGLIVFVPSGQPLDQYIQLHPEFVFTGQVESAFIDRQNPYLLASHLKCAAHEYPLTRGDEAYFGANFLPVVRVLEQEGLLKPIRGKWYFPLSGSPAHNISLRSLGEDTYDIITSGENVVVIGQADSHYLNFQIYPGSIYMASGRTYKVTGIVEELKQVHVEESDSDYFTMPVITSHIHWQETLEEKASSQARVLCGLVKQTAFMIKLKRIQFYTGRMLGHLPAKRELPVLETSACIYRPSPASLEACSRIGKSPIPALIALRHLLEQTVPLSTLCDKSDIQVLAEEDLEGAPALAVLDIFPGGLGLAQKAFEYSGEILEFAASVLKACTCSSGCPACVGYNPVSLGGSGDIYPDKAGASILLQSFMNKT